MSDRADSEDPGAQATADVAFHAWMTYLYTVERHAHRVRFSQDETFSGVLVPFYARLRLPRTRVGFDETNQALRDRAEQVAATDGATIG